MDADALLWQTAVLGAGGAVTPGRLNNVSNFIIALKAASVWTKLDRFWWQAGQDHFQGDIDLVARASQTPVAAPTFTANQGYTTSRPAGVPHYLNEGTPGGTNYTLNSAHMGFWLNTDLTPEDGIEMGASTASADYGTNISLKWSDGNLYTAINDANGDAGVAAPSSTIGHWIINRNASTTGQVYQNGSLFRNTTQTSTAVTTTNFVLGGCFNHLGVNDQALATQTPQFRASHLGGSLSSTDATNLFNAITTLINSLPTEDFIMGQAVM